MNKCELETKIRETQELLEQLRSERTRIDSEEIMKGLEEGKYYRIDIEQDTFLFFKNSNGNLSVNDGTGTIGYDGMSYVSINKGIFCKLHKFSSECGFFYRKTFPTSRLCGMTSSKIQEIPESRFLEEVESIKKQVSQL